MDRLRAEGHDVEMIFFKGVPNTELRFLQAQADVFVDMLTYGFFGATAREAMMLGKPVVCYLRPEWLQQMRAEIPSYVDELPVISATPDTVHDVLTDLIQNPEKRREIGSAAGSSPSNGTRPRRRRSASTRSTAGCCRAGLGPSPFAEMLRGPKVTLAPLRPEDSDQLYGWINDRDLVVLNAPFEPVERADHDRWFELVRARQDIEVFGIRRNRDDRLIGSCQLRQIDRVAGRCELDPDRRPHELGSWAWHRGGRAAARARLRPAGPHARRAAGVRRQRTGHPRL